MEKQMTLNNWKRSDWKPQAIERVTFEPLIPHLSNSGLILEYLTSSQILFCLKTDFLKTQSFVNRNFSRTRIEARIVIKNTGMYPDNTQLLKSVSGWSGLRQLLQCLYSSMVRRCQRIGVWKSVAEVTAYFFHYWPVELYALHRTTAGGEVWYFLISVPYTSFYILNSERLRKTLYLKHSIAIYPCE